MATTQITETTVTETRKTNTMRTWETIKQFGPLTRAELFSILGCDATNSLNNLRDMGRIIHEVSDSGAYRYRVAGDSYEVRVKKAPVSWSHRVVSVKTSSQAAPVPAPVPTPAAVPVATPKPTPSPLFSLPPFLHDLSIKQLADLRQVLNTVFQPMQAA